MIITITKGHIQISHDTIEKTITIFTREDAALFDNASDEYYMLLKMYPEIKGETRYV